MYKILSFLFILLIVNACRQSQDISAFDSSIVDKYLAEHSRTTISVKDPIILRFKEGVLEKENWKDSFFSIRPIVQGQISWLDESTIQFFPEAPFPYSKSYKISISPKAFSDYAEKTPLVLPISTKHLEYAIQLDREPAFTAAKAKITGNIRSSDWVNDETVEELLSFPSGDISWIHSQNGKNHHFTIDDIQRGNNYKEFSLTWEDSAGKGNFSGQKGYAIPPLGLFEVSDIRAIPERNKIEIRFTDELDVRQKLDGYFRIDGKTKTLKYTREGSVLTVFLEKDQTKEFSLSLNKNIQSIKGKTLAENHTSTITLAPIKPEVRLVGNGTITPYSDEILFPFEAKGLHAVDVEILKVFSNNILQYLQNHTLNSYPYYLENVGRIIHQEKIDLSDQPNNPDYAYWHRYAIDLQNMIDKDPGAIYVVRVGYRKNYTEYPCEDGIEEGPLKQTEPYETIMRWNADYDGYRYQHESDPCYPVYYNSNRFIQRNILASNLGIIAKGSEKNSFQVHVRNLNSLEGEQNAKVAFYDFQQQLLLEDYTNSEGKLLVELRRKPGFIIVQKEDEFGYLSLKDQTANSLSDFNIGGSEKVEGIDGFIYGERGVWRPGDTMHLTFVLEDPYTKLPEGYPFEIKVKDARGQLKFSQQKVLGGGNMYVVRVPTELNDPTGNWHIQVGVGEHMFSKTLKVETVKPNRLKVDFQLPERVDISENTKLAFSSSWLYGAPAKNLKARVEASYSPINTGFEGYGSFEFDDPARKINAVTNVVFDQNLDNQGKGVMEIKKNKNFTPPGRTKIGFRTRVFEPTGEYSEDYISGLADPYSAYVGVNVPESSWGRKYLSKEDDSQITFVAVDKEGRPLANRKLSIGLYEAEWSWWYNRTISNIYRYNQADHLEAVEKINLTTGNNGQVSWSPDKISGYKYMVRVCDEVSGHCSGELFYTPYYDYETNNGAASILKIKTDKTDYLIGEEIQIDIPSNLNSKILVSVENGESIVADYWVDGKNGSTPLSIPTTNLMAPNVYIHVTLIQEYRNQNSELPLRMYGILPVTVEDPATRLLPEIKMAENLRPKRPFEINISESSGQEMNYTLAVVDEGLLGLTRFETPDLWKHFYAKQALGLKTWDIYDEVLQGFGGEIDKHISIGGDADLVVRESGKQANRFNPVVLFKGPFKLEKSKTNKHTFTMDNYMGAVRVMVVAKNKLKYGSSDKTVTVTNPLMILPTVPRTLAPKEDFALPINIIATDEKIVQANINVETGPGLTVNGNKGKIINLRDKKDIMASFNLSVEDYQGPTFIKIAAKGGGHFMDQTINFIIENPNPRIFQVKESSLDPGEKNTMFYKTIGTKGTNEAVLEISTFPAINLEQRLDYLIRYPYGCLEQTTSSVFPQLYLDQIVALNDAEKENIFKNIQAGIKHIATFQMSSGGMAYWKGSREVSDWGTSYAGHFLMEAKRKGFFVSSELLNKWVSYQKNKSKSWTNPDNYQYENLMQAYRLYVLAKAGESEWGAMNALRSFELDNTTSHVLAAAYIVAGQEKIGEEVLRGTAFSVEDYQSMGQTYGSGLRDRALMVEALLSTRREENSNLTAKVMEIARDLGNDHWYSTQTTAFALLSVGKYLEQNPPGVLNATIIMQDGKEIVVDSKAAVHSIQLDLVEDKNEMVILNDSEGILYARIIVSGKGDYGATPFQQKNLKMTTRYTDLSGKPIDPAVLSQGTDFIAEVTLINQGSRGYNLEEMALSQVFPSGWEIRNERISGVAEQAASDEYEYRDIRDNGVHTFFDMQKVKTFRTILTAAYAGKYYLPDIQCEAMYDHNIIARIPGQWITVIKEEPVQ